MKKSVRPHKLIRSLKQPHYLALSIALLLVIMSSSVFAYKTYVMEKQELPDSSENMAAGPVPWADSINEEEPTSTTTKSEPSDQATSQQQPTTQSPTTTTAQTSGQSEYDRLKAEIETTRILCTEPAIAANTTFMEKQQAAVSQSYVSRDAISYPAHTVEYAEAYNIVANYRNNTINAAYDAYTAEFQRLRDSGCDLGNPAYKKHPEWELIPIE